MKPTTQSCMRTRVALLVGAVCFIGHLENTTAAPCDGVPFCETQQQAPVHYWSWQTSGWAYYCSGDHPYYWNNGQSTLGFGNNFTWDNSCFSSLKTPLPRMLPRWMQRSPTGVYTGAAKTSPSRSVAHSSPKQAPP